MSENFVQLTPTQARIAEAELLLDCYEAATGPRDDVVAAAAFMDSFLYCLSSAYDFSPIGKGPAEGPLGLVVALRNIATHQSVLPLITQPHFTKRAVSSKNTVEVGAGGEVWYSEFQIAPAALVKLLEDAAINFPYGAPQYRAAAKYVSDLKIIQTEPLLIRDLMRAGLSDAVAKLHYTRKRLPVPYITRPIAPVLSNPPPHSAALDPQRTAIGDSITVSAKRRTE